MVKDVELLYLYYNLNFERIFMVRYFTSRMISEKLNINLAKWKRWSRAFLPPDPLGGKQSGYARHYSITDALTVYLGGLLVGNLNLSVPESRSLLPHFLEWMKANRLMPDQNHQFREVSDDPEMEEHPVRLIIQSDANGKNQYKIHQVWTSKAMAKSEISLDHPLPSHPLSEERSIREETYSEIEIYWTASGQKGQDGTGLPVSEKMLHVSWAISYFLQRLGVH